MSSVDELLAKVEEATRHPKALLFVALAAECRTPTQTASEAKEYGLSNEEEKLAKWVAVLKRDSRNLFGRDYLEILTEIIEKPERRTKMVQKKEENCKKFLESHINNAKQEIKGLEEEEKQQKGQLREIIKTEKETLNVLKKAKALDFDQRKIEDILGIHLDFDCPDDPEDALLYHANFSGEKPLSDQEDFSLTFYPLFRSVLVISQNGKKQFRVSLADIEKIKYIREESGFKCVIFENDNERCLWVFPDGSFISCEKGEDLGM